jgi:spore maturation protein CgeB
MTSGPRLRIVMLGLSITSSWGNGHATTYRALMRALHDAGHDVLFLERDTEWYAAHRDLPEPPYGRTQLYTSRADLAARFEAEVREADCVIVGSYVPDGIAVGEWVIGTTRGVRAFYDLDTPITLAALERGDAAYITRSLVARYDLYLSFTGGPVLERLERVSGCPCARPLYCSFDPATYYPEDVPARWDLGYMGTYSDDRQPTVARLLIETALRAPRAEFVVAGASYPPSLLWPRNVAHVEHIAPSEHRTFYTSQRFTLNVTRAEMIRIGYSPSVRLFEAAACATPVISDRWDGLDTFFVPGREILLAESSDDVLRILQEVTEEERRAIGARARAAVMAAHTPAHRVAQLEEYIRQAASRTRRRERAS